MQVEHNHYSSGNVGLDFVEVENEWEVSLSMDNRIPSRIYEKRHSYASRVLIEDLACLLIRNEKLSTRLQVIEIVFLSNDSDRKENVREDSTSLFVIIPYSLRHRRKRRRRRKKNNNEII